MEQVDCASWGNGIGHTCALLRDAKSRDCVRKSSAQNCVFLLKLVVPSHNVHQLAGRIALQLNGEVADLSFQGVDVILCSLTDGALGFTVIGSFPFELGGCERCDAASTCSGGTLLGACRAVLGLGARGVTVIGRRPF